MLQLTGRFLLCAFLATIISPIVADYVIDVKLIKFENYNRILANGRTCSSFRNQQCQTTLHICARPGDSSTLCSYGDTKTGVIGDNVIDLNKTFIGFTRNPIIYPIRQPFQKFVVSFTAKSNNELIAEYVYQSGSRLPQRSVGEARYELITTRGSQNPTTHLTYQIRSYCSQGYYGPNCITRCDIPITEQTRFQCDVNGQKVCKPGFSGPLCNINADLCRSSPCKNGATCVSMGTTFKCICTQGYTGQDCNKGIDECSLTTAPCFNGGICVDGINGYHCRCAYGYTGPRCETVLSACLSAPCMNGGTCSNAGTSFMCQCLPNFYGNRCQFEDKCRSVTCLNGGRCATTNFVAKCHCQPGFTGTRCEIPSNSCQSAPCQNGGTCSQNGVQFICHCPAGFVGRQCEQPFCSPNICQNGGTCQLVNNQITCICLNGFQGDRCQVAIQCYPPCQNGGTCNRNTRMCDCPQGFVGRDCSIRDACASNSNVCQNGGRCQLVNNQITCICQNGFYGDRCQFPNQFSCYPKCQNGGTCNRNTRICDCPHGFVGRDCSIGESCASNPYVCQNGGRCQMVNGQITCLCQNGFSGDRCQFPSEFSCYPKCQNGGTCNRNTRICDCLQGFGGRDCSKRDPCASKPCYNNGQCRVQNNFNYVCVCNQGWTGKNCQNIIRSCSSNPCLNGGLCYPNGNSFICNCRQGWTGQTCDIQTNPCTPNPCQNNGRCSSSVPNGFTCNCLNGWSGTICTERIPHPYCPSRPCLNGGTCIQNANQLRCRCLPGFKGTYCEVPDQQGSFKCPESTGHFPDPQSCRHFYRCDWNIAQRVDCPGNLHFNKVKKVCDWPYRANCNIGQ
ncbi:fibropellin-1-like isoform X2 [Octopus bimaculoides]|uniref:fibropellin-1-like isoform X2 n=1 Tax=Octopus bimaculoides TaxID=37653 RepID=UPI0022E26E5B|nr:fibropellin-1-like isoform X2 [Octopus bimaculoides]